MARRLGEVALAEGLILRLPAPVPYCWRIATPVCSRWLSRPSRANRYRFRLTQSRFKSMGAFSTAAKAREPGDLLWKPSPEERRAHRWWAKDVAIQVRLHAVQVRADLTLLADDDADLQRQELADLYRLRLDVETDMVAM